MPVSDERFRQLTYEKFRDLATDDSLSEHERVGFPDSYRQGFEEQIVSDIVCKLPQLERARSRILDIGPGCSGVPRRLIELCRIRGHHLTLVDSAEMLARLPDWSWLRKVPGRFPDGCPDLIAGAAGRFDAIVSYSVLQYVFAEGILLPFFDAVLALLAPGGKALIGDIPNHSKRRRFFASAQGKVFHRRFTGRDEDPAVDATTAPGVIDDAVVTALLLRGREKGFDVYVVPQAEGLPMSNRREDVIVSRA